MKRLFLSFKYAFNGIWRLILKERNFQIHLSVLVCVIALGCYFGLTRDEWVFITIVSGLVLSLEAINSSIEKFADFIHPDQSEKVKIVKDIAAGATVIAVIAASIVGLIVFLPYIRLNFC